MPPIGPSSELTHADRPYELTLLVGTVLVHLDMIHERDRRTPHADIGRAYASHRAAKTVWYGVVGL